MKRWVPVLLVLIVLSVSSSEAQNRFGFGFILGEPTGLSVKYRMSRENAIDGALGFSPFDRFRLHADYLWHARPFRDPNFALHYGIGMAVGFGSSERVFNRRGDSYVIRSRSLGFGARVPFGIDYSIPRSPVEIFFEVAPLVVIAPDAGVGIDIGIGVRFYP